MGLCLQHRKSQEAYVGRYVRHVGQIDLEFFEFTSRLGKQLINDRSLSICLFGKRAQAALHPMTLITEERIWRWIEKQQT